MANGRATKDSARRFRTGRAADPRWLKPLQGGGRLTRRRERHPPHLVSVQTKVLSLDWAEPVGAVTRPETPAVQRNPS